MSREPSSHKPYVPGIIITQTIRPGNHHHTHHMSREPSSHKPYVPGTIITQTIRTPRAPQSGNRINGKIVPRIGYHKKNKQQQHNQVLQVAAKQESTKFRSLLE
ncbi:hypothetical protein BB561_003187 [Smittium simulii]|uniref:Uncharacterized protein n=1 Tax=Smittium simulii TaxID=133385 RepID=A0A2T9YMP8_9FUNG|nr:hypothetical protein BB561_003187 [Smittium simulii]